MSNVNKRAMGLGMQRSIIRDLFEFGMKRIAEVGAENVFDFSIGNPSVPAPDSVNETAIRLLRERKPDTRVVVGGAVMTKEYADAIGADCYAKEAMDTVRYADLVFGN